MRSQSDPKDFPIAPAVVAVQHRVGARPIPSALYWLVALAVGSSFYVAIEPAPTDLLFMLLFAMVVMVRGIRFPLGLNPLLSVGLLGFFAGGVVSLLWGEDLGLAIFHFSVTTYLLITWYLLVVVLANYGAPMWDLIRRAFLVAATIAAVIGLVSHFSPVLQDYLGVQAAYGERARGSFKDPNVYAPFLCAALLLVINNMITRRFLSIVSMSLLCLFSVEILASFSRAGYVNVAVSLFVFFLLHLFVMLRRDWLVRWLVLGFVGLLVVVPVLVMFLDVSGLEEFLLYRSRLQNYDAERFATHALALDTIGKAPFGIGPGNSPLKLGLGTHNLYLQIAVENGVFSILCFLLFLATTFWISLGGTWRRGPYQDVYACCIAILVGILANSLVIDSLHWRHFFLFLAIPVGLLHHELWVTRALRSATSIGRRTAGVQPS